MYSRPNSKDQQCPENKRQWSSSPFHLGGAFFHCQHGNAQSMPESVNGAFTETMNFFFHVDDKKGKQLLNTKWNTIDLQLEEPAVVLISHTICFN